MTNSSVSAEQVAEKVFTAVKKGRFLILTHPESRWTWRFRRWFPEMFHRSLVAVGHHMSKKLEK